MTEGTERVTQLWPKELKEAAREAAGERNLSEFTIEAVRIHMGVSDDLSATDKELGEARYFCQQLADQLVLGIESPEERMQFLLEIEWPNWIDTTGWPEKWAKRVPLEAAITPDEQVLEAAVEAVEIPSPEEAAILAEAAASPTVVKRRERKPEPELEPEPDEEFVPSGAGKDDFFAKIMEKTGGKLADVPGLKLASEIEKPAPDRRLALEDIEVDF